MKNFTKINLAFMAKKKHFALLCALLCASMMGWADPVTYCEEIITANENSSITAEISCTNPSENTYVIAIFSSEENYSGIIGDNFHCKINGAVDPNCHMTDPSQGCVGNWDSSTKTYTFTITSSTVPVMTTPIYLNINGQKTFDDIQNQTFDWPASCGGGKANSDLTRTSSAEVSLDPEATSAITYTSSSAGAMHFTSSDELVATVNGSGVVTAVAAGSATITVAQDADEDYKAGSFTVTVNVNMPKKAATKNYGSLRMLNVDLYDWNGNFAGTNACGQVDLYVVTFGDDIVYKAVVKGDKTFEATTNYFCQLRTWKPDLTEMKEQWALQCSGDLKTRTLVLPQTEVSYKGISAYGDEMKLTSYMVLTGCGARTMKTVSYTRNYVNNYDSEDSTAPVLGDAIITSDEDNFTISFDAITSEEVFYMIEDIEHCKQYVSLEPTFTIAKDGSGITYNFSCYAIDYNGNVSGVKSAQIEMPFVAATNLALNKPVVAGYTPDNKGEVPTKANDGNEGTAWVTYACNDITKEWWYVDLCENYDISNITVVWGDLCSSNYILQTRTSAPSLEDRANDAAWTTVATITDAVVNSTKSTDVSAVGRYVRIHSLARSGDFFRLKEFRVFASGVAEVDNEKPSMSSASLVTKTAYRVVISVAATDNVGVTAYHVVDGGHSINTTIAPVVGQIEITGLTPATSYNFTITALDAFGNESDNNKSVVVTTNEDVTAPNTAAPNPPERDARWVRPIYTDYYASILKHGFVKNNWGSVALKDDEEKAFDENHYLLYDMTSGTQVIWGQNDASAAAIVANDDYTAGGGKTGVDASAMEYLHLDIWSNIAMENIDVRINDDILRRINLTDEGWQQFDVELSSPVEAINIDNVRWFKFTNISKEGRQNIAFDNVYFWRTPAAGDEDAPESVTASVTYKDLYTATIAVSATDDNNISYSVKHGETVMGSGNGASGETVNIRITGLEPNTDYSFSVIAKDILDNEADPIAVEFKTKAIPASAPTPTRPSIAVKSLYSNAYEPAVVVGNYCENWYLAPNVHSLVIGGGDNVLYYDYNAIPASSAFGWGFNTPKINAKGYQKLHMSIYPMQSGTIELYPVKNGGGELYRTSQTLTAEAWNEVELDYTDETIEEVFKQLGFRNYISLGAFFIDNIYFYADAPQDLNFADDGDANTTTIAANDGIWSNVTINRNISADDTWYTLCLPFDMSAEKVSEVFGASTIATLESSDDRGSLIHLNFDYVNAIQAGKPYLIKLGQDFVAGTTISNVTIKNVDPSAEGYKAIAEHMHFQGTFNKIMLKGEDKRYVSANNELYSPKPVDGSKIGAFRCFFTIPDNSSALAPGKQARIVFGPQQATGIDLINDSSKTNGKLLINGVLYIIRDGNTYNAQGMLVK